MNVVDSSAWLEYFADGPNAGFFAPAIEATDELVVPSICLLEVFKRVCQQRGEGPALQAVAVMHQGRVVDLDSALSLIAARIATARNADATLWTQDADFEGLPGVKFRAKKSAASARRSSTES